MLKQNKVKTKIWINSLKYLEMTMCKHVNDFVLTTLKVAPPGGFTPPNNLPGGARGLLVCTKTSNFLLGSKCLGAKYSFSLNHLIVRGLLWGKMSQVFERKGKIRKLQYSVLNALKSLLT